MLGHLSKPTPVILLALSCAWMLTACVERTISITSEPSEALVFLNDEEVGRTPLTVPFTFYGTYDVRLERDGYKPLWTKQKAKAPWWEAPGPDLLAEAVPNGKSHLDWHFVLEPLPSEDGTPTVDTDALLERAKELRSQVEPKP
ncbi:MAG: PEGA domain-containing protein [Phycisphaeraceae bacterium]|nr:PEGA domain-containing protein [Phycisphaeraceae bacterium]